MKTGTITWPLAVILCIGEGAAGQTSATVAGPGADAKRPSADTASFAIAVKGEVSAHRIFFASVMPGADLSLRVAAAAAGARYGIRSRGGVVQPVGEGSWTWRAPSEPGLYPMVVTQDAPADSIRLNVFVLVPRSRQEGNALNGYRIDAYPARPLRGLAIYRPPPGFIEVTAANVDTRLTPHFTLRQFLCKQEGGWPKYVVLNPRLLLKLEVILAALNEAGYASETLAVLSGYRTPYYNRSIGNVRYSRHVWGDAADIYVDVDGDGYMDDLNRDGRIDYHDAQIIYGIVDDMYGKPWYAPFVGGLGRYRKTSNHGPFVHVDTRGFRARWGT